MTTNYPPREVSKFELMSALFNGKPFNPLGFDVVLSVQVESGTGAHGKFNVTGLVNYTGKTHTIFVVAK